jgi:membrane protein YqaA with SNARE-associated domain
VDSLGLALVAFASALVPVVNIEAYLGLRVAVADVDQVWLLGLVAAVGQMLGKLLWYQLGASSLGWGWVRRRLERPRQQEMLRVWRRRTEQRPVVAALVVLCSAVTGLPPFAIVAVLAGQLRMSLPLFAVVGLAGRWLRFTAVLGGLEWVLHLLAR